jgi:pyridoxamine 5'-phosphate oxidase
MVKINHLRKEYKFASLDENELDRNPFTQFENWLKEAIDYKVLEPTAMTLSTANSQGIPSSRMVLLKEWTSKGGVFFTNIKSQKALEIEFKPIVSCLFWWKEMDRQVIMESAIEKVSKQKTYEYFSSRPIKSQIATWVSMQGQPLASKEILEVAFEALLDKWKGKKIPLPPHWGGYRIVPHTFQFWQGRQNRLHDRFIYIKHGRKWDIKRLYP